jgi:endonuclease YncB( thermonuclease family)
LNCAMRTTIIFTCVLYLAITPAPAAPPGIVGPPTVINGETLKIKGRMFKLYGIMAPDLSQTCEVRGSPYNCGKISRTALMDLVAGVEVRCVPRGDVAITLNATPVIAHCFAQGYDLSEGMVYTGWAMAMPRRGTKYLQFEKDAEKAQYGLWKGKFTPPWQWQPHNK